MSSKKHPDAEIDAPSELERLRAERKARTPEEQAEADRRYQIENAEAFRSMNAYFEEHGFPFPQFRRY